MSTIREKIDEKARNEKAIARFMRNIHLMTYFFIISVKSLRVVVQYPKPDMLRLICFDKDAELCVGSKGVYVLYVIFDRDTNLPKVTSPNYDDTNLDYGCLGSWRMSDPGVKSCEMTITKGDISHKIFIGGSEDGHLCIQLGEHALLVNHDTYILPSEDVSLVIYH